MKKLGMTRRASVLGAAALMFSALLPAAAAVADPGDPQRIQKISVSNQGGYVFSFKIQYLGKDLKWHTANWESDKFPVGQTRTTPDLGTIGVPASALAVLPYGSAVAGESAQANAGVVYNAKSTNVANYIAKGTTLIGFEVVLTE
ncbi:hypothetical protein [Actinoplanes derwentensis]|uniref:Uncharacterized protein n=2 Tax=Actinoplanes derwentensis TaxID=113562 RepID=A0A1H2DEU9_9ACTN|nr:hypothetical protein [Actinoplanes derwentensis]SDT81278.1 hypothetical protein SAMN04489716_9567 [Actinoplanes derwentensis]